MLSNHLATALKISKYGVISGPYFPVFGVNTEIYGVHLRIQYEYRKIWTRKNSVFGHFSPSNIYFKLPINSSFVHMIQKTVNE